MRNIMWQEIKGIARNGKTLFILSVLAFTCACMVLNAALSGFNVAENAWTAADENYGDKAVYRLSPIGGGEINTRIFGIEHSAEYYFLWKAAFEQLKTDPSFRYRYNGENPIEFFDFENGYGADDFPPHKEEFRDYYPDENVHGYAFGGEPYDDLLALKAIYADNLFRYDPYLSLSSGEWFTDEDFFVSDPNNIRLPVILGHEYIGLYQLGDEITNAHIAAPNAVTLTVIGFLSKDSYFYDNNNVRRILNRYMVVPSVEIAYDPVLPDGGIDEFARSAYDLHKLMNGWVECAAEDAEAAAARVREIFWQNKLYEFRLFDETGTWPQRWAEYRNSVITAVTTSVFIVSLLIAIFCVQLYHKILKNKKKYSIYIMGGIRKTQLMSLIAAETLAVFIISTAIFTIARMNLYGIDKRYMLDPFAFALIAVIAVCLLVFMGLFGSKRIYRFDMSAALRECE